MPAAYVLVLCDHNYSDIDAILNELSKLPCVVEVNKVKGHYDIIAKLSDNNADMLKEAIGKRMVRIHGLSSTLTLMAY